MVPINFHQLRTELRQYLLNHKNSLLESLDPFNCAWVCYALYSEGIKNNLELLELFQRMLRWFEEEKNNLWETQRNLAPISAIVWLSGEINQKIDQGIITALAEKVKQLNPDNKWSPLRDPEQVFLLSLGLKFADDTAKEYLKKVAYQGIGRGLLKIQILYTASLIELGENVASPQSEPQDPSDIIALVWFSERYGGDKHKSWEFFSSVKDQISFDLESSSDRERVLSVPEMAMIYEAVVKETLFPDPILLFDYFPFHPKIKRVAKDRFKANKYADAVFKATIMLNREIQKRTGIFDKEEVALVQATMKNIRNPARLLIKFNDRLDTDSGMNEQKGLALICEGIFSAFRNPKAHEPDEDELIKLDPYEALEQLIIIDYLMKRIERAKIEKQKP